MRLRGCAALGYGTLLLLSASLIAEARRPAEVFVDESQWVTAGYVAWKLIRQAAPLASWQRAFDERELQDWGNKNPPLGKYLIGVAVTPYVTSDAAVDYRIDVLSPLDGSPHIDRPPPPAMLVAARSAVALSAACALWAVYLIARELLAGSAWALVAPLFLFCVPSFQQQAVRVSTDAPEIALLGFATYWLIVFARRRGLLPLAATLVCSGLACAVKLSAGAWCLGATVYAVARTKAAPIPLVLCLVLPAASFIAVNPYLYIDPIGRSLSLAHDWHESKARQQADPRLADSVVRSAAQGARLVATRGVFAPTALPHMRSLSLDAMKRLAPVLLGLIAVALVGLFLIGYRLEWRKQKRRAWPALVFVAVGLALEWTLSRTLSGYGGAAALGLYCVATELHEPGVCAFASVFASTCLATSLWLPFDWSRYYLPVVSQTGVVYALGTAYAARSFAISRRAAALPLDSLAGGLVVGVTALVTFALGWAVVSILTPPLLP